MKTWSSNRSPDPGGPFTYVSRQSTIEVESVSKAIVTDVTARYGSYSRLHQIVFGLQVTGGFSHYLDRCEKGAQRVKGNLGAG